MNERTYFAPIPEVGQGVFAATEFARKEIIIVSPVYVLSEAELSAVQFTNFNRFIFPWPYTERGEFSSHILQSAVVLGEGAMLNSDLDPNCYWDFIPETQQHLIKAKRNIAMDEQLTLAYGWTPEDLRRSMLTGHELMRTLRMELRQKQAGLR